MFKQHTFFARLILRCLSAVFLLTVSFCFSQNSGIDSLKAIEKSNTHEDSSRVKILLQLAKAYMNEDPTIARSYIIRSEQIAKKIRYKKGLAQVYTCMGMYHTNNNAFDSALISLDKGLSIVSTLKSPALTGELLKRKGAVFYYRGESDSALFYFNHSYQQFEIAHDSLEVVKLLNNIGAISIKNGKTAEAINYFFKCLAYDEAKHDIKGIASDCNNIGIALTNKKDYVNASKYLKRALDIRKSLPDSAGIIFTTNNMGNVLIAQKRYQATIDLLLNLLSTIPPQKYLIEQSQINNNLGVSYFRLLQYDNALFYLQNSIALKKSIGTTNMSASSIGSIGQIYFAKNKFADAIKYSNEAFSLAKLAGELDVQVSAQNILAQSYLIQGQKEKALDSYSLYVTLNDSLYSLSNSQVISEIQTKYETDKKEQENKLLQQENSLKQNAIDARNKTILVLAIGIVLIVILIAWRLNVNRLKKKFIELENQKKLQEDRERISRDLHDNVGGQLSYVMFSLEGKEDASEEKRKEKLQHLANSLRSVTGNLRETIWALNKESLSLQDVSDKLKLYARNMFAYSDIKLKFDETIIYDAPLHPAFALHLFRMCQEILNNVFKHAQASELHITVQRDKHIHITITDDGIGFNPSKNADGSFGLSNLQTRALEINAQLSIESELQKGTTVSIIV